MATHEWNELTTPDRRSLEAGLRRLPKPKVPEHLEATLIADIPASVGAGRSRSSGYRRWLAASAGIAAAAGLVYLAAIPHRPAPEGAPKPALLDSTSPDYIITPAFQTAKEETDPCVILPPSPNWHSPSPSSSRLPGMPAPTRRSTFS